MNGYAANIGTALDPRLMQNSVSAMPPPPDCINTHLSDLAASIDSLGDELAGLANRLDPVLRPGAVTGQKDASSPTPVRSSVANTITNQVEKVQVLIRRVRDLRESVDL